jgi:hypothetical protein
VRRRGHGLPPRATGWQDHRVADDDVRAPLEREMTPPGEPIEREITAPVALCLPNGQLNRSAVGWTRHPLHRTNLRGWGRTKRWEYWGIVTPTHVAGVTISSLDYAAVHQAYVLDRRSRDEVIADAVVPLGRGALLPESLGGGPARARAKDLAIDLEPETDGTRIRVTTPRVGLDVLATAAPGQEALGVVVPWSDRLFQYTVKDLARPVAGRLTVDGTTHDVGPDAWAVLDHGRGRWPYDMTWNWGAGSGLVEGRVVGVQVGGRWTENTGSTENALLLDGRLHKNSDDLVWEYDRTDWLRPWRVHDLERARVDLTFEPFHERVAKTDLLVVAGETHQCFGTWSGWMTTDDGERVRVDGTEGWAEEARNRW